MRRALRQATRTRRQRTWLWVLLVILGNLGMSASIALVADQRMAELEQRIEIQDGEKWRGALATTRSELGGEVAELRSELTELRQAVGADEGDLRNVLDALERRVNRIEGTVSALWRMPSRGAQARLW